MSAGSTELPKTMWQKTKMLWHPFQNYKEGADGSWQVDVSPEALRCVFYIEFVSFAILGIILSLANSSWNGFDLFDNPIVETFGNANLCVFFDDPPFSYIGAALWCPLTCTITFYLYIDLCRVYAHKVSEDDQFTKITPTFYAWYRAISIFVGVANFYWVEVFAVQPEQHLSLHWTPFGVWMWAMYIMGLQHYVYMWAIGLIDKKHKILGRTYMVFFGIWTLIKFALDLINVAGGNLGQYTEMVVLAYIADFMFDFSLVGLPPLIYLLFVEDMDLVRLSFNVAPPKKDDEKGKEEERGPDVVVDNKSEETQLAENIALNENEE